jgi:hypothetical protein
MLRQRIRKQTFRIPTKQADVTKSCPLSDLLLRQDQLLPNPASLVSIDPSRPFTQI